MGDNPIVSMTDRRSSGSPTLSLQLHTDRLECWTGPKLAHRIAIDQVKQVRLSVETAGRQAQVVCRVSSGSSEIVFGSRRVQNGIYEDNVEAFQTLMVALHEALRPRFHRIVFVEGQTLQTQLIVSLVGLAMAALALAVMGWFALDQGSYLLAAVGFPFLVIGGYLSWMFRPTGTATYDPEKLVERFSKGVGS